MAPSAICPSDGQKDETVSLYRYSCALHPARDQKSGNFFQKSGVFSASSRIGGVSRKKFLNETHRCRETRLPVVRACGGNAERALLPVHVRCGAREGVWGRPGVVYASLLAQPEWVARHVWLLAPRGEEQPTHPSIPQSDREQPRSAIAAIPRRGATCHYVPLRCFFRDG